MHLPVQRNVIANIARHSVTHRTPASDRIGWHDTDEGRLFEESHFQVKLLGPVLWRNVAVSRPNDVPDVESILFPRIPIANLVRFSEHSSLSLLKQFKHLPVSNEAPDSIPPCRSAAGSRSAIPRSCGFRLHRIPPTAVLGRFQFSHSANTLDQATYMIYRRGDKGMTKTAIQKKKKR